ncbi:hypothetical protein V2J09_005700 [Rumex salicifolius]
MEGELGNFVRVWSTATISGIYCYAVSRSTKMGLLRHLLLLPSAAAFTFLPLTLTSFHLGGGAFFSLTWLANFKLLLLSFDTGPLSSSRPAAASLPLFLCTLLLPIKLSTDTDRPDPTRSTRWAKAASFVGKVLFFGLLAVPYTYKEELPEVVLVALHTNHTYLVLEMSLAATAALTRAGLGLDRKLAPQFNEPFLSTSLQDFWGKRWNLIASDILKQTVHSRIRSRFTPLIGKQRAKYVGIFATFLVSGIMHELMYYYITRVNTKWEIIRYFVFNGVCLIFEIMLKTTVFDRWQLHRAISTLLTGGFLGIVTARLFYPTLMRNGVHEKATVEYLVVANYVKSSIVYVRECVLKK